MKDINNLLVQEDIEGFIALGAPANEYESEAAMIAEAIALLKSDELTEDNLSSMVASIWIKNFNLGDSEIKLRLPAIQRVVRSILK